MPWLSVTTFLPLGGVIALLAWPRIPDRAARAVALIASVATFGMSVGILATFDQSARGFQLVEDATWVDSINLRYIVGVDGINLFMVLLTTFLMPIAIVACWRERRQIRTLLATLLLLETTLLGVFVSLDLLLFFLFFEAMLFPAYLIIGGWGGERRAYAAIKFFLYTMAGSAFLFLGVLFLYFRAGSELGAPTFDLRSLQHLALPVVTGRWLFAAFLVAFAVKVPLVPLHTWLPDAYTESPAAGLVLIAGVLPKVAAYGLIRFNLRLFPEASVYFADLVSILALLAIVYGAIVALIQVDVKRLVAYSSISHLGFVVLGIFALNQQGVSGGVLEMVNHGLSTAALFLVVAMVAARTGTRDFARMGGLYQSVPALGTAFLLVALASLGLPGLNHFVGEFLVILGTFAANRGFAVVAAIGIVLTAIYLLWAYQRIMHGPVAPGLAPGERLSPAVGAAPARSIRRDLRPVEYTILVPLIVAIVAIGMYPKPLLDRINPSTRQVNAIVQQAER
jgi:NADH-quinone oxidoreductase subunit M